MVKNIPTKFMLELHCGTYNVTMSNSHIEDFYDKDNQRLITDVDHGTTMGLDYASLAAYKADAVDSRTVCLSVDSSSGRIAKNT